MLLDSISLTRTVLRFMEERKGFTLDLEEGRFLCQGNFFGVGLAGGPEPLGLPPESAEILKAIRDLLASLSRTKARMQMVFSALGISEPVKLHLGGWFDPIAGLYALQLSVVLKNRSWALRLARHEGERFIFGFARGKDIPVRRKARHRALSMPQGASR